ncbi:peptide ABC transporter permease [Rhodobacteraceae bacterium WD3A24]|nr:peptide ABC transporter permease [Rhodobacteraceae bacterium WD3A24]
MDRRLIPVLPFIAVFLLFAIVALFAPWLAPQNPYSQDLLGRLRPPGDVVRGTAYLLGTDELGRDLLSRVIYGARVSMLVATLSVVVSLVIGVALGMLAALFRGAIEILIMRIVDVFLSIPPILLAIITVAVLGPGLINVVLVLALTRWPRYARVAFGQTLSLVNQPYVRFARHIGNSTPRLLWRHILPNIVGPITVVATLEFGLMVLFEAGLSFLGLGVQPPMASWGSTLNVGRNYVATAWWIALFPGLCLFLLILSVNLIGDYLRDRLDPTSKR